MQCFFLENNVNKFVMCKNNYNYLSVDLSRQDIFLVGAKSSGVSRIKIIEDRF